MFWTACAFKRTGVTLIEDIEDMMIQSMVRLICVHAYYCSLRLPTRRQSLSTRNQFGVLAVLDSRNVRIITIPLTGSSRHWIRLAITTDMKVVRVLG